MLQCRIVLVKIDIFQLDFVLNKCYIVYAFQNGLKSEVKMIMVITKTFKQLTDDNCGYVKNPDYYIEKYTRQSPEENVDIFFKKLIIFDDDRVCMKTYESFCEENSLYCDTNKADSFYEYAHYVNKERWLYFEEYIKLLMVFNDDIFKNVLIIKFLKANNGTTSVIEETKTFNNVKEFIDYYNENKLWETTVFNVYLYITKNCLRFEFNEFNHDFKKATKTIKIHTNKQIKII